MRPLWEMVDPDSAGQVHKEQFVTGLWLIYMGYKAILKPKLAASQANDIPIRYIAGWTTCDVCSSMLIPGYPSFGCNVCIYHGKSHYYVCQTCLAAGRVCHHIFGMRENVLRHREGGDGVLARPRVLATDGETMVYFECRRCKAVLPAGSTVGYCAKHARGMHIASMMNTRARVEEPGMGSWV